MAESLKTPACPVSGSIDNAFPRASTVFYARRTRHPDDCLQCHVARVEGRWYGPNHRTRDLAGKEKTSATHPRFGHGRWRPRRGDAETGGIAEPLWRFLPRW